MNNIRAQAHTDADDDDEQPEQIIFKLKRVLREETYSLQPQLLLTRMLASLIPRYTGGRLRSQILRAAGFRIGHGTVLLDMPLLYGSGNLRPRLEIGDHTTININCIFELNAPITIGEHAGIGHEVLILTSSHKMGDSGRRAGSLITAPVVIKSGAWLGARSIVLPGVTIGEGSVVGAGSLVTKDVPANTLAGGMPARVIRELDRK